MKLMRMQTIATLAIAALVMTSQAFAADNVTGVYTVEVPAGSDVVVTVPYVNPVETSSASLTIVTNTITVSGTPFTVDQYNNLYYVELTTGPLAGFKSKVTDTTTNSLVVADDIAALGAVNGNEFQIVKYPTLESVFPDAFAGTSFVPSTGTPPFTLNVETTVRLWNVSAGTNQSPARTYYYLSGDWKNLSGGANADDQIIEPGTAVIVRNPGSSALNLYVLGNVQAQPTTRVLQNIGQDDDTQAGLSRAIPVKLKDLGLGGTAAFKSSTGTPPFTLNLGDTIRLFDNAATGTNKSPTKTYYYLNGAWRDLSGGAISDDVEIPVGAGFLIRKQSGVPADYAWTEPAPF